MGRSTPPLLANSVTSHVRLPSNVYKMKDTMDSVACVTADLRSLWTLLSLLLALSLLAVPPPLAWYCLQS